MSIPLDDSGVSLPTFFLRHYPNQNMPLIDRTNTADRSRQEIGARHVPRAVRSRSATDKAAQNHTGARDAKDCVAPEGGAGRRPAPTSMGSSAPAEPWGLTRSSLT
ncbi:MAG: hypothetical protein L6Q71_03010 [Planctomycetes bacterium]|nr:hypothetical protein [Planctomycetota bacterium]NUQ35273.1 hypothetical protein [Planctomycetaceae bacterium]